MKLREILNNMSVMSPIKLFGNTDTYSTDR